MRTRILPLIVAAVVADITGFCQPANPLLGEKKWETSVALAAGPTLGTNELVYGVTQEGRLYAWEAAAGQLRWETNLPGGAHGGPLVVGPEGRVYVAAYSGLHALDGDSGRKLWHHESGGSVAVGPDGTVFLLNSETLYALDPMTGAERWSYHGRLSGIPALSANGLVFTVAALGRVLALDARTGQRVWEFQQREVYFGSVIVAGDGTVLASGIVSTNGWEGHLIALDGATGEQLWDFRHEGQILDVIIVPDGTVCVGMYSGPIHVLDGASGEAQRQLALPVNSGLTLAADGTLYVGGARLHALDFATGETNWVFEPDNFRVTSLNVGSDGTVYFREDSVQGRLYAVRGASPLANSAWPKGLQNAQNSGYWKVSGPPEITKHPRSHWAAVDASTTFHFYSPVARPLHIQWRFNGQCIPGATNESLRIERLRFADAGNYSVAVSNEFGSAVSDEATLWLGYALAVTTLGPGIVQRVPDREVYPTNSTVELTAVPQTDRNFLGWSGDATGTVQTLTLALDRNYAVTATFEYLPGDMKWRLPVDDVALSVDGILYGHTLYTYVAVDTTTRRKIWEVESNGETYSPPVIGRDGTVYFTSYGESLNAIDGRTGELKWSFHIGVCTDRAPAVGADGTIYFGGEKLFAIDPATGTEKWSVDGAGGSLTVGANGMVYAACAGGMCAFNGATGEKLWEFEAALGLPASLPAIGPDDTVYFGSGDGKLYALDGSTGHKRWEFVTGGTVPSSAIVGPDGRVYTGSTDGKVYALNGQTGAEKWNALGGGRALTADGTLYVAAANKLYALDSSNGEYLWEAGTDSADFGGPLNIGPDGTIYYGTYALHGTSPLATGGWPKFQQNAQNTAQRTEFGAPAVTRPPSSHWAAVDRTTTFEFYSPVSRPVHVQWRFNGQDIPGATNEILRLEGVQFSDGGNYSVVLSNQFGVATSAAAILNIGYQLTIAIEGLGTVLREPDSPVYPTSSAIQLTATPQSPRTFLGWSGDATGQSNTLMISLSSNHHVTANFEFLLGDKKWEFLTEAYQVNSTPALAPDGTLYFTGGATLYAVDRVTRRKKWEYSRAAGSPALGADGTVYVGSGELKVYALNGATGEKKWESVTGDRVQSSPALGIDGTIYVGSDELYALDGETGAKKWKFYAGSGISSSAAIGADGTVYFSSSQGMVYALDGATGWKKWEFRVGSSLSSPAIGADGTVYIGSSNHKVYALHGSTGGLKWEFTTGSNVRSSPAIGPDGTVYVGSDDYRLHALNGATGQEKWSAPVRGYVASSPAIGADSTVYVCSSASIVYALDALTGDNKWEAVLSDSWGADASPTLGSDGTLYIGSVGQSLHSSYTDGPLIALQASSGLAASAWPKFLQHLDNRARVPARPLLSAARSRFTPDGFEIIAHSELGEVLSVDWTSDFATWNTVGTGTNLTGALRLLDAGAPSAPLRLYRARKIE